MIPWFDVESDGCRPSRPALLASANALDARLVLPPSTLPELIDARAFAAEQAERPTSF